MEKQLQELRAGKIVLGEDPLNLEMPFESLRGFITPTESFYVRTHFAIPKINKKDWRLRVEGEVENGFPLRAIVPGWYAMASIKWLQRITVTDRTFTGYYQTMDYAYWARRGDAAELIPLTEMQVKAEIARPVAGDIVPANSNVRVH